MRYFVDTEFNGFGGDLISLAAVPEDALASPFYEAVECLRPTDWAAEHILPVLQTKPRPLREVATRFAEFLDQDAAPVIVADWPEDIAHAAALLTNGKGGRLLGAEVVFKLLGQSKFSTDSSSEVPHNAYYDALALREWVLAREGR